MSQIVTCNKVTCYWRVKVTETQPIIISIFIFTIVLGLSLSQLLFSLIGYLHSLLHLQYYYYYYY